MSTFREQTTILSGLIALIGAAIFAWLLIIRKRKRWIYLLQQQALLAAGGLFVLVAPIASWLDHWTGHNNLSWWLGYSLGVGACLNVTWQMGLASDKPILRKLNQIVLLLGALVLAEMAFIYFTEIIHAEEWIARIPRTSGELIFSVSFFLYGVFVALHSFMPFWRSIRREANPYVRFRIRLGNWTFVMALTCFTAKTLYLILTFYFGGFEWVNTIALTAMLITTCFWLMSYLPLHWLPLLYESNPAQLYYRWQSLTELRYLQNELNQLMTSAPPIESLSVVARFHNLQRLIYRTTVAILDGKRYLDAYIEMANTNSNQKLLPKWTSEQWQLARELHDLLRCVDSVANGSLAEITSVLEGVSRKLRGKKA